MADCAIAGLRADHAVVLQGMLYELLFKYNIGDMSIHVESHCPCVIYSFVELEGNQCPLLIAQHST